MKIEDKIKNFESFRNLFNEKIEMVFEEFDRYFSVESYFITTKTPFLEKNFYETLMDIISNLLKGQLTELEYYVNVKHSTPLANSDIEVLAKENEKLMKYYFNMHIAYKKFHQIVLMHQTNTPIVAEYIHEHFDLIKELNKYFIEIQDKLISNLNNKLKEIEKKKEEKFQSSIFH